MSDLSLTINSVGIPGTGNTFHLHVVRDSLTNAAEIKSGLFNSYFSLYLGLLESWEARDESSLQRCPRHLENIKLRNGNSPFYSYLVTHHRVDPDNTDPDVHEVEAVFGLGGASLGRDENPTARDDQTSTAQCWGVTENLARNTWNNRD